MLADRFVGTWQLVSAQTKTLRGDIDHPLARKPSVAGIQVAGGLFGNPRPTTGTEWEDRSAAKPGSGRSLVFSPLDQEGCVNHDLASHLRAYVSLGSVGLHKLVPREAGVRWNLNEEVGDA